MLKRVTYRRKTNEVFVGGMIIGGEQPVALQSMTNTDTLDTKRTAEQCIKIYKAGADLVRITAQSVKAAENFKHIKEEIIKQGFNIPLSADIHFNPKAALKAVLFADKVRINPGNFADTKHFKEKTYTQQEYEAEKERVREVFLPFLRLCEKYKKSIRIGVNHGSLSDRIMSRYGDTTKGMTESAMEYLRICKEIGFTQVVLSMKSANPKVMIEANRMLVNAMQQENMHFPIHIGVTEAGKGDDGRIKSAIGIGTLLADGIGDTIRVSLTEAPEKEIPVARKLRELSALDFSKETEEHNFLYETHPEKRISKSILNIGGKNPPVVLSVSQSTTPHDDFMKSMNYDFVNKEYKTNDSTPDALLTKTEEAYFLINSKAGFSYEKKLSNEFINVKFKRFKVEEFDKLEPQEIEENTILAAEFSDKTHSPIQTGRDLIRFLKKTNIENPLLFSYTFAENEAAATLKAATYLGTIIIDYGIDGLILQTEKGSLNKHTADAFGILQACRLRITKPDYIACPSCGRTLFDIEKTLNMVQQKTAHLSGVKIAVMGCIVNGPGEMADADYGYVGAGIGKVNLYKGKNLVKKNILEKDAIKELINLIEFTK